jgi:protein-disulfide isomerase
MSTTGSHISGQQGGRVRRFIRIAYEVSVIVIAAIALSAAVTYGLRMNDGASSPETSESMNVGVTTSEIRHRSGYPDVKVIVAEFVDYQCPFCTEYAHEIFPAVQEKLIAAKRVQYFSFNFPLNSVHPAAFVAGEAAECSAEQQKFWQMRERLFGIDNGANADTLTTLAGQLGLNKEQFRQCMEGGVVSRVLGDIALGRRLGVDSTPQLLIGVLKKDGSISFRTRLRGVTGYLTLEREIRKAEKYEES